MEYANTLLQSWRERTVFVALGVWGVEEWVHGNIYITKASKAKLRHEKIVSKFTVSPARLVSHI